jgi:tripartite ATP-independent transporter DctP family solute receptor
VSDNRFTIEGGTVMKKRRALTHNYRWFSTTLLVCGLLMFAVAFGNTSGECAAQQSGADIPNYKWSAALNVAETTLNYKIVNKFKQLIGEKSGGKIVVNIYPNGQLGGDKEMMEGLVAGNIHFLSAITTILVNFVPENAVFDLPSALPNIRVMRAILDSAFKAKMNAYNKRNNILMLGYADAGFRQTTSSRSVRSVKDFSGLKIRVMQNPNHIAYWKSLGASPVAMDFGELYVALQQRTVDAQENPYMNIVANKLYEAQKYVIETNHLGHIIIFIMSNKLYEGLPEKVRRMVDESAKDAIDYGRSLADDSIAADKKVITDKGLEIISLSPADLDVMKEKAAPVYENIRKKIGNELVDSFLAEIEKVKKNQ